MTYNQVQSFQINDYANHYVDIEITGYRALYSKSIAGRGVAGLWAQQGQSTALINQCLTVILEYIDLLAGYSRLLVWSTLGYTPKTRQILEVYWCDHARQLEYSS